MICQSSDHRSKCVSTSCQILRSSVSAHMNNVATVQEKTIGRSVAVSSHIACHVSHVIAPLHPLTSSFAIRINRVAPPNMLPTHLATTLSALARRMCYGSSFSGRESVPTTTYRFVFFALFRFHRQFERRGPSKITGPARFSAFPGFVPFTKIGHI